LATGCGGEDQGAERPAPPSSVTTADLQRDGNFWNSLTPDLKDDLVDFGKDRLAEERGSSVRQYDNDELVAEIDREYTNQAKVSADIYGTYVGANNALASETLTTRSPSSISSKRKLLKRMNSWAMSKPTSRISSSRTLTNRTQTTASRSA
jgi:hypothetical protein